MAHRDRSSEPGRFHGFYDDEDLRAGRRRDQESARWEREGYDYVGGYRGQNVDQDFHGYPVRQGARGYRPDEWERWLDRPQEVRVGWTVPEHQYGSSDFGMPRRGEHRGKGPKGYTRSDARIREDVCDRLSDDDQLDASEITVLVQDGEVTLEGTVTDRRAKQRAEALAEAVGGVHDVHNRLRKHKGLVQEIAERVTGSENNGHHAGSGTKNTPANTPMSR